MTTATEEAAGPLAGITTLEVLERGPLDEGGWLANRRVFIRVDFNVPLDKKTGEITDDSRIRGALPTIERVLAAGAKVILASHLGRPDGRPNPAFSLEPTGARLAELTGCEVHLPEDCIGDAPKKVIHDLRVATAGGQVRGGPQICLLENLRFHQGETDNDEAFAKALAELCDVYIDDAFGAVHRAHASVDALPRMKKDRAAGLLLQREIEALGLLAGAPASPYVAVLGGAKVSDKIEVIEALLSKVDALCIGGAMANTFLAAQGHPMQASRIEENRLPLARTLLQRAESRGVELLLPTDLVVAASAEASAGAVVRVDAVPSDTMALDIGPDTIAAFAARLDRARTVFWNGPMGVFESEPFSAGTREVALAMSRCPGFTVVGGGDSAAAVYQIGEDVAARFGHISTGGGASLEFVEGERLPGIEALRQGLI